MKKMKKIVAPSVLSADFGHLQSDIEMINKSKAEWIHLDVMDGVFVPNISFGFPVIKYINKSTTKSLDVHLMIVKPDKFITEFKNAGTYMLTVHYEACTHLHRTVQAIKAEGMKAGVALNPHTPVSVLEDILCEIDMVLIMTVNPGYGGQKFIDRTLDKVRKLRSIINENSYDVLIQVDGGINPANAQTLYDAGANVLVAGNAVFGSDNPMKAIENML